MSIIQVYLPVCDRCGDCDNSNVNESESELRAEMDRQGWGECLDGDLCPDCAMDQEEDEEQSEKDQPHD